MCVPSEKFSKASASTLSSCRPNEHVEMRIGLLSVPMSNFEGELVRDQVATYQILLQTPLPETSVSVGFDSAGPLETHSLGVRFRNSFPIYGPHCHVAVDPKVTR